MSALTISRPKSSLILQLHRNLYQFRGASYGGDYPTADNVIAEPDAQGIKAVCFHLLPARKAPEAVDRLCRAYGELSVPVSWTRCCSIGRAILWAIYHENPYNRLFYELVSIRFSKFVHSLMPKSL